MPFEYGGTGQIPRDGAMKCVKRAYRPVDPCLTRSEGCHAKRPKPTGEGACEAGGEEVGVSEPWILWVAAPPRLEPSRSQSQNRAA
jgi:hypothetical protein